MYAKCLKWRTFVRQSEGFVRQSEDHLLYKCTPNWGTWKKVRHWVTSEGNSCFEGSFRQLWHWDKKSVSILKNSRRFWNILEKTERMLNEARNLYRFRMAVIVWKQDRTGYNKIYGETRFNNDVMFLFMYIPAKTWDGVC